MHFVSRPYLKISSALAVLGAASAAQAAWVNLVNQTTTRMPVGAGLNTAALSTTDPDEKDYAWGDVDKDGDTDLIVARKIPFTLAGGKRNVLFMNEGIAEGHAINGVLVDRTIPFANTSINVPQSELNAAAALVPPQSNVTAGFLDLTNDRDVVLADVNNDGWLDIVTATTISDVNNSSQPYMLPRFLGHPRVYINLGEVDGEWQGFVYDYSRVPQMLSKSGVTTNPRFCSLAAGDFTGDGYVDLMFGDYDTGEMGPVEAAASDFDNKLLINQGAANPGVFVDETIPRFAANFNYGGTVGSKNLAYTTFGAASVIADMNGDALKDIVKHTSLTPPQHVATIKNHAANMGVFATGDYKMQYSLSSYFVSVGDLNGDGKLDMVMTDDNADRFLLNTGNDVNGSPNFSSFTFTFQAGSDDGFGSQNLITDLDNDGWNDVLISDVDVDGFGCSRRLHIYENQGNAPNVTIREASPSVIATSNLTGTHNVAVFDIDNDGWKDLVIGRCSSTAVWMNTGSASIKFGYPAGRPDELVPDTATTFQVQLTNLGASTTVAGSAKIFYSVNGAAFTSTTLNSLGGGLYEATLPASACGASIRYYLSGQITTPLTTFVDPPTGTYYLAYAGEGATESLNESFEGGAGSWIVNNVGAVTTGAWEVAAPNGTWNEGVQAATASAMTGSNAFVTQNGSAGGDFNANDVDGGATELISPVIDLTDGNANITFGYWFYSSKQSDTLNVSVSNNGGANWTTVASLKGPNLGQANTYMAEDNAWKTFTFAVGDYVTPTNQVQVKFTANGTDANTIVEAGIDDFVVNNIDCGSIPCPADITGNGTIDTDDLLAVINGWGGKGGPADITGNGTVDVDDLLAVINGWGACQ